MIAMDDRAAELMRRVALKSAGLSMRAVTDEGGRAGDLSWPGMVAMPKQTGQQLCEFIREQFLKIGTDIGDPTEFWRAGPGGGLIHVGIMGTQARMIAEAEREMETAAPEGLTRHE